MSVYEKIEVSRGEDGKFKARSDVTEIVQDTTIPEDKTPKETEKAPKAGPSDSDRERAATALRRAKVPESAKKAMSEDELHAWGSELAKSQSEADRMAGELAQSKKTPKTPDADSSKQALEQPATKSTLSDFAAKLAEQLALDDDGRKTLEDALTTAGATHAAATEKLTSDSTAHEESISYLFASAAKAQLVEEFPELKDKDGYAKARARMQRLAESDSYAQIEDPLERVTECMRDACGLEFRDSIKQRAADATKQQNTKRNAGQPETVGRAKDKYTGLTGKARAMATYDLLESGLTVQATSAKLNGA